MSALPNRTLLKSVLLLAILLPLVSLAQVKIKEKVELRPKATLYSNPSTELKIVFHWSAEKTPGATDCQLHLAVFESGIDTVPMGFNYYTGTTSGNYSERITSETEQSCSGEAVYIDSDARPGWYNLYAVADTSTKLILGSIYYAEVYVAGQLDTAIVFNYYRFSHVSNTPYKINWEMYKLEGEAGEPTGGIHFRFDDIADVQYGEARLINVAILDTNEQTVSDPPEHYFKFELLGDTSVGFLRDVDRGKTGIVLDSVYSTSVEFDAWGREPQSPTQVTFRISAHNGSILPVTATFRVLPPEMRAIVGKTVLSYGDTTSLRFQVRSSGGPWADIPSGWWAKAKLAPTDTFGFLYTIDSTRVDNLLDGQFSALNYYAKPQTEPDSIDVFIQLESQEPGIFFKMGANQTVLQKTPTQQAKPNTAQLKLSAQVVKQPPAKILGGVVPGGAISHYGLVRLKVKKNMLKILDHAPWTIWPDLPPQSTGESRGADRPGYNPKRSFRIQVLDASSQPLKNAAVKILTKYQEGSGGHGHVHGDKALPQYKQGVFWSKGQHDNPIHLRSDGDGMIQVDSLVGLQVSGKFLVTAMAEADTTVKDTVNLIVRVPGLVEFGTGDYWNLTGNTNTNGQNHLSNHWCTATMKDSLTRVLKRYYEWTESEGGKAIALGLNDMSLEWGGVFEYPGKWQFGVEHSFHRVGVSVDIDRGEMTIEQLDKLTEVMQIVGGGIRNKEIPNIHYGFDGGN